jgi:hypothetical protein
MVPLETLGHDDILDRDLFVLAVQDPAEVPATLLLPSRCFVCVIAWNADGSSDQQISSLARGLLRAGAVYVCAWGADCQRVHDIVDAERDASADDSEAAVMTTWHDRESLADVLRFVLAASLPAESYIGDCGATLALSIGSPVWATEIRAAFSAPRQFLLGADEA